MATPVVEFKKLDISDLMAALRAGWADFLSAPWFGLFFAGVYVLIGLVLVWLRAGMMTWTLAISLGFPLFAPFAAVGLYDVSRRREVGQPLNWAQVLGVIVSERHRQIPWIGAMIIIYVLFWTFLAHMIFALFMGPSALTNATTSFEMFGTDEGIRMLLFGGVIGAVLAFLLFAMTVVSLPLVLERDVDFVTAMLASLRLVHGNLRVMVIWATLIAVLTVLSLVPAFLGLFVTLPLLGHATWHLYRRALTL